MENKSNPLFSISPIDGRYKDQASDISQYFSEFAYAKYRVLVELKYLMALSGIGVIRKISSKEEKIIFKLQNDFNLDEAHKIKEIEEKTRHDVKAIEYYIKEKLSSTSLSNISIFIHFGLTSEDVNNIALRIMLKDLSINILLPELKNLSSEIFKMYKKNKDLPMLARTHGQTAVPTTLGKEFLVFSERLKKEINILRQSKFSAKLNGAVGNYNALYFAYPKINWQRFSKNFISDFGLEISPITTQIAPYEDIINFFQTIQRINGIVLNLNQDLWRYISDGYFLQENRKGEIGSSTMPQKINPIYFENSEGNLIIANSLISGFVDKLPLSRLQRDLSGSTISRNFGASTAHCLIAYQNTFKGLKRIKPNEKKIFEDLNSDWSILSEAIQIYLKKNKIENGYEIVRDLTRGEKMNKDDFLRIIDKLPLNKSQKSELKKLTPENYLGNIKSLY